MIGLGQVKFPLTLFASPGTFSVYLHTCRRNLSFTRSNQVYIFIFYVLCITYFFMYYIFLNDMDMKYFKHWTLYTRTRSPTFPQIKRPN